MVGKLRQAKSLKEKVKVKRRTRGELSAALLRVMHPAEMYDLHRVRGYPIAHIQHIALYRGVKVSWIVIQKQVLEYEKSIDNGKEEDFRAKTLARYEDMIQKLMFTPSFGPQHAAAVVALSEKMGLLKGMPLHDFYPAWELGGKGRNMPHPTSALPAGGATGPGEAYAKFGDTSDLDAAAKIIDAEVTQVDEQGA